MTATAIKTTERPILFSGPMVKALLDGRKTMTRRIIKPQPPEGWSPECVERYCPAIEGSDGMMSDGPEIFGAYNEDWGVKCPYGSPGTKLWVRETWRAACDDDLGTCVEYRADGARRKPEWPDEQSGWKCEQDSVASDAHKWSSSNHLPRWASRLTLELTDVRVEQLGEITSADVVAEGFPFSSDLDAFKATWADINGKWQPELLVWVLSFRKVSQ